MVTLSKIVSKNRQIRDVESREYEAYEYYDENFLDENNEVGGGFGMQSSVFELSGAVGQPLVPQSQSSQMTQLPSTFAHRVRCPA